MSNDIKILIDWLKIREINGYAMPSDYYGLMLAVAKSALLERMLAGIEPLPIPPPKSFSYPWYELIEKSIGYPLDVFKGDSLTKEIFGNCIIINQFPWEIIRENGPDDWNITYAYSPEKILVEGEWRVYRENDSWVIKKDK